MVEKENENTTYENRYKHKLNMLWPGQTMMKLVSVLLLMGIFFRLLKWQTISVAAFLLSGGLFAVLLILVAIELHQDKVLNEIAMRENAGRENHGK